MMRRCRSLVILVLFIAPLLSTSAAKAGQADPATPATPGPSAAVEAFVQLSSVTVFQTNRIRRF